MGLKITSAAIVGFWVLVAGVAAVFVMLYFGVISFKYGKDDYYIHFHFASIRGLNKGAKFKINGNEVGIVESTEISPLSGVDVTVRVYNRKYKIHENAKVVITKESLLGSSYIEVTEPIGGFYDSESERENFYFLKAITNSVKKGDWIYYIHEGEEKIIGQIEDIVATESGFDKLLVKNLSADLKLDKSFAFVPQSKDVWDSERRKYIEHTYIDVFSPLAEGSYFQGTREAGPEDLIAHIDEVVLSTGEQIEHLNREMLIVLQKVQALLDDVEGLIDKEAVEELFQTLKTQIEKIGSNVEGITTDINAIVGENKTRVDRTISNIESASESIKNLAEDPTIHETITSLSDNLNEIAEKINDILDDIEELTGDPELKGEIKDSIHTANETLKNTSDTIDLMRKKLDKVSESEFSGQIHMRYQPEPDTYYGGLDLYLYTPDDVFFTAGLDQIGEDDLFNLQVGYILNQEFNARFGLKRSKIGLGMDYHLERFFIRSDFYDPNDVVFDIYTGLGITDDVYLTFGGESLFDEDIFNLGILYEF